jgi:hypothetical protein
VTVVSQFCVGERGAVPRRPGGAEWGRTRFGVNMSLYHHIIIIYIYIYIDILIYKYIYNIYIYNLKIYNI